MRDRTVTALNVLLKGELSAANCYQRVLRRLPTQATTRAELEECLGSHKRRARHLEREVSRRAGAPARGLGLIAHVLAFLAVVLASLRLKLYAQVLESIEIAGIARYDKRWSELDETAQDLVARWLFPQQVLTRQSVGLLFESPPGFPETTTP